MPLPRYFNRVIWSPDLQQACDSSLGLEVRRPALKRATDTYRLLTCWHIPPLHALVRSDQSQEGQPATLALVRDLLAWGVPVDQEWQIPDQRVLRPTTVMVEAAYRNQAELVKGLLDLGARVRFDEPRGARTALVEGWVEAWASDAVGTLHDLKKATNDQERTRWAQENQRERQRAIENVLVPWLERGANPEGATSVQYPTLFSPPLTRIVDAHPNFSFNPALALPAPVVERTIDAFLSAGMRLDRLPVRESNETNAFLVRLLKVATPAQLPQIALKIAWDQAPAGRRSWREILSPSTEPSVQQALAHHDAYRQAQARRQGLAGWLAEPKGSENSLGRRGSRPRG